MSFYKSLLAKKLPLFLQFADGTEIAEECMAMQKEAQMKNKKVIDKRSVRLERVMSGGYIPFLEGRPDRETVIGNEDLINLSIALNTVTTIDELLEKV